MTDLLQLAERVERYDPKASPDNRADELDLHRDIVVATGFGSMNPTFKDSFLRSLDAAMSLVPEGCRFNLNKRPFAKGRQDGFHAQVWFSRYYETASDMPNAWAATPALALCAASLRALAAQEPSS